MAQQYRYPIVFFVLACLCLCSAQLNGKRTLVVLDNLAIKSSHSAFFAGLEAKGYELTYVGALDEDTKFVKYNQFNFDNLILFAPTSEDLSIGVDNVIQFIDTGHNVLVAAAPNVSEPIRKISEACGVEFDEAGTQVIDHFNVDAADAGYHTLVAASNYIQSTALLGKLPSAPVLYSGIGHSAEHSRLVFRVLTGSVTAYSHDPKASVREKALPQSAGTDTLLVTAVQTRNNARVLFSGSLDMFSNKLFFAGVNAAGKQSQKSGNEDFCTEIAVWTFAGRGVLRAREVQHHVVGSSELNPRSYRIKDNIEYSIVLEEYDGVSKQWKPFVANNVQLELIMIDPYVRLTLPHVGKGRYSSNIVLPDVYGVYKFSITYNQFGYSNLEVVEQVSVHPYRHNEFERFLDVAFPYYASAFSMMAGFVLFGIFFLYSK